MLREITSLTGYKIHATDDYIGKADDLYFDEKTWTIRYIVVDTGLLGRKVLLSPYAIDKPDWETKELLMNVSKEQVENSPDIDLDQPVSRQQQIQLHTYYQWPGYMYPPTPVPEPLPPSPPPEPGTEPQFPEEDQGDPHLRSAKEVKGYHIQATDGEIGHVEDFVVNDEQWVIRYLIVDTKNWLPGKKVLIAPEWCVQVNWAERDIMVKVTRETVKDSPKYEPWTVVDRKLERTLYKIHGLPGYWQ